MSATAQPELSAILIVKNEAEDIEACLQSLHFADEIIVLDSGSDDDTVTLCRRYTDKVFETDWPGFGLQKQRALDQASGRWVLSIDADERIPAALRDEIKTVLSRPDESQPHGYEIPRLSSYCGRHLRYGGWYPDYTLRLFQREMAHFTPVAVHEKAVVAGPTEKLKQPMLHETYATLEEVVAKVNQYSELGAQQLYREGKRSSMSKAIGKGLWAFLRTWLLRGSILEGREGLMLAISNAEATYYKYAKLWLLQRNA